MWFALCDKLHSSAEAAKAGVAGIGAYAMAGSWCADHKTDGHIPREVAHRFAPLAVWKKAESAGLVRSTDEGYEVVDFLKGNPSRAQLETIAAAKSEAKQKAGRIGGVQSGKARRGEAETKQTRSRDEADAKQNPSKTKPPSPSPSPSASGEADPEPPFPGAREATPEIPNRPGDGVLAGLLKLADEGHPWCMKIREELPSMGGRLSPGLRETAKKIIAEQVAKATRASAPRRGRGPPAPDVQRAPSGSVWADPDYIARKDREGLPPPPADGNYGYGTDD